MDLTIAETHQADPLLEAFARSVGPSGMLFSLKVRGPLPDFIYVSVPMSPPQGALLYHFI